MTTDAASKRERLAALVARDRLRGEAPAAPQGAAGVAEAASPMPLDAQAGDRYQPFPLTRIQQSYLIGRSQDFVLGNIATHNYFEIDLDNVDVERLERAWNRLIAHHDMLRAVFSEQGSQRVLAEVAPYRIAFADLSAAELSAPELALQAVRDEMSHRQYIVDQWPLFELRVVRKPDQRYRVHFSMDMLIADAMSTMILIRDLDRLYADPAAALPELTISFKAFVEATCAIERSPDYDAARDYWRGRLDSLPAAPELPLAKAPETISAPRFRRREFVLDAAHWERCQRLAQQAGITPSVFLVSVFAAVLARWSKSGHFCLNLTLLNRPPLHAQINALVGDFTSLVLLEIAVDARLTLQENAARIQAQLWRDMSHRQFDGVDVLRLLNRHYAAQQAMAMPIVFTSALGLAGSRKDEAAGELFTTLTRLGSGDNYGIAQSSQVWLDHVVRESEGALGVSWDTLEDLFPDGLVDAMFAAYAGLLGGIAEGRVAFDGVAPIALPAPQQALRAAVNATAAPLPSLLLHEPFREQVQRQPAAIAVRAGDCVLDYAGLDHLAAALADQLADVDAGRSELIAVVMRKGWEQIVAVLGILGYGAAYLPVDANLPAERIALLLQQAGVRTVVTQVGVPEQVAFDPALACIVLDRAALQAHTPGATPHRRRVPPDLAYVIFTSGSTGMPKGVAIEHRGAVNTIVDINRRFDIGSGDKVLAVSSLSFDLSVYDIFGVLGAGGTVVVPEADKEKDPAHWLDLVVREQITLWNTVPPLIQLLVEQAEGAAAQALHSLRWVLSSGDWLSPELPGRLTALHPQVRLVSLGGATEASIWSIFHPVPQDCSGLKSIAYGKPLLNQTFHVLDEAMQDRPDWVPGQLYIGGVGLAREYWGDPVKTAASFVVHPTTGERLYRTGDLGRYQPDGDIEFLGRNDRQVKIRGNRVELGEIEAALRAAEGIQDAVVLAEGNKFGRRRLVAYLVSDVMPDAGSASAPGTVIADLAERAVFKFERLGLRRFDAAAPLLSLGPLPSAAATVELALAVEPAATDAAAGALAWTSLAAWLECLADAPADGHVLPKRLYPSAGSTYALQCYLGVGENAIEALPAGAYYYDPARHGLVALPGAGPAKGSELMVCLVADRRAIAPLYGRYADRFAAIEAGHMQQLLLTSAACRGVRLAAETPFAHDAWQAALALDADHRVMAVMAAAALPAAGSIPTLHLSRLARQSYRRFLAPAGTADALQPLLQSLPAVDAELYVCIHGTPRDSRRAAVFRYLAPQQRLVAVGDIDRNLLAGSHGIENQDVHAAAHFTLYLVRDGIDDAVLHSAGRWAQQLMQRCTAQGYGLCPVGHIALAPLRSALQLQRQELVYCLLGGAITVEQTQRWSSGAAAGKGDGYQDLRNYLARALPDYMIPSVFVAIERIPLTANGKLDRASLPSAAAAEPARDRAQALPSTPLQGELAGLWRQILGVESIGVDDNFFEAGGDSLSAIRLLSLIRKSVDAGTTEISLKFLFENPTIRQMADNIGLNDDALLLDKVRVQMQQSGAAVVEGEL